MVTRAWLGIFNKGSSVEVGLPVKNPPTPPNQKSNAAEGRDRSELGDSGDGEKIKAARKQRDPGDEPPEAERPSRTERDDEEGEGVDEVVEGGRFPIVDPSRLGKSVGETVGPEGAEGDSQEQEDRGNPEAGVRGHDLKYLRTQHEGACRGKSRL